MGSPLKFTNEQILTAYRNTGSVWKAAKTLGACGQSVWERLRRLDVCMPSSKWTPEEVAELHVLAPQCTIGEIARRLGRPYTGVAGKISKLQLGVRFGNQRLKTVPRGSGLNKKTVTNLMEALQQWAGSLRQFCIHRGLEIERVVIAFQRYRPQEWVAYVAAHSELKPQMCPECHHEYHPFNKKQQTCSRRCASRRRSNQQYFGGKRSLAVGMEEGVCQLCERECSTRLAAHHVYGKANDPDNDFLIALCNGCHQLVGQLGGRVDVKKPEFWENLIALAITRKDGGKKPLGYHVCVDVEELTAEDLEAP